MRKAAIAGWISFLVAAGSASAQGTGPVIPLPGDIQQELATLLGPGVVGEALPSPVIEDPAAFFPLESKASSYQVTSGRNAGKTQSLDLAKHKRPDGHSAWRFQLAPTLAGFLRQSPEGHLTMPAVSDADHGVVVVTTPPEPFLLKGIKPGESRSFQQTVSVNYLDDPSRQDYSGELQGTYTYVGMYRVTVPAGSYDAALIQVKCDGKVGPAHTQDTAYYLFAKGQGVVAMIQQEDAEAFWIIHLDSSTGKVLAGE